jgi:hypothetical protein
MSVARRNRHELGHAPVAMYAENLQLRADVSPAYGTRITSAASRNGVNCDMVAYLWAVDALPYGYDFAGELVTYNARIFCQGIGSMINVHIRAANPGRFDAHQNFAGFCRGLR